MTTTSLTGSPTYADTVGAGNSRNVAKNTDTSTAEGQKNLFLGMLVEQMKNQDPTSPMDSKDMMNQMSQMTSTEQLTNMATTLSSMQNSESLAQGVSMIGSKVTYLDQNNAVATGTVASVAQANGSKARLVLAGGSLVDIANVTSVSFGAADTGTERATA